MTDQPYSRRHIPLDPLSNARDEFMMQAYEGSKVARYLYQPTSEGSRCLVPVTGVPKPIPPQPDKYRVGPPPRWTYERPPVVTYLPRPDYDFVQVK